MKFNRPLVILLGGVLVASGAGCSAASALLTESRPAAAVRQNSADRMVAIGQVFEKQGRLEQAEAMYRGALKKNPSDASIRRQLAAVQSMRKPMVGPASAGTALAAKAMDSAPVKNADVAMKPVPPETAGVPKAGPGKGITAQAASVTTSSVESKSAPAAKAAPTTPVGAAAVAPAPVTATPVSATKPVATPVTAVPTPMKSPAKPQSPGLEDVLAAADTPENHCVLLVDALVNGDQIETRCLAATLLGECSPGNEQVKQALKQTAETASDTGLLLAVVDSQLQRGELSPASASRLTGMLNGADPALQIQVATLLRHFAGRDSEAVCVKALESLLGSSNEDVRATAVLTLGDFGQSAVRLRERLTEMSGKDSSVSVREAATVTLERLPAPVR